MRYRVPSGRVAGLDRLGLSNMTIGLSGRNLFTITNYSGFDPEVGSTFNRRDTNPYPQYRTFTGEIQIAL